MNKGKVIFDLAIVQNSVEVEYLREKKIISRNTRIAYAGKSIDINGNTLDVEGKDVIGHMPYNMACVAASYTEILLHLPMELSNQTLILEDYRKYAGMPVTYKIKKV